ncbi:MAG TPA: DNA-directed RNA polymerase subunit beta [Candidatus Pullichristensenella stercorigallinarum]|uniref:DNA-directed RNA polymerase subunit beta n=1 Tax=Candidatus Pullichristensenella stercorigallinarum TaxID=2840909 RepID=A0A9D0ZK59_9FIRM|nr:DNA-directed RNA polymerase subunit beta [Candidatus Pullichristensenella stercorigallinarum]
MVHPVQMGKRTRMSFARIEEALAVPDLIEVQKNSYRNFLKEGLREVLADVSPITDYSESLILEFTDYSLDDKPKYTVEKCKERDATFAAPLKVTVRLTNRDTHEIKESEVFMGDFPLMTEHGTFIINGAERVIVSQLVRSPGVYFARTIDKTGAFLYSAQMIPNRGAWIEYETDANGIVYARIDRARKLPVTVLLRALGVESDEEITRMFGDDERVSATITRDAPAVNDKGELRYKSRKDQALIEIYNKLRPGEPPSVDSATSLLNALFFDPKRYDLAHVGRYKYNKKLALAGRVAGMTLAEEVKNPYTGEILAEAGEVLSRDAAERAQNAGVNEIVVQVEDRTMRVIGNNFAYLKPFLADYDPELYAQYDESVVSFTERVHVPTLVNLLNRVREDGLPLNQALKEAANQLVPKHVLVDDIISSVSYQFGLFHGIGDVDDIDHLGNRRVRSVGELLQNQIRVGLSRLERVVKERMAIQDLDKVRPQDLINIRPVSAAIKEFFGSSQLSQFMDQPNPLAELTHKRRLNALGPGGLNRDRASFAVRDVHYSHYGRICPIETPEGPNIGLMGSLATYARINEYGFIEAPYRKIDKATGVVTDVIEYMTADEEDHYVIAQANEPIAEDGTLANGRVTVRRRDEIVEVDRAQVDYIDVSPRQLISVATGMIPFLENDDANRALMGSNMQRQAVPLLKPEAPYVGTGIEYKAACDSGVVLLSRENGVVTRVTADEIVIRGESGEEMRYHLTKFARSNQGTCINQHPIVKEGEMVKKGQVIADGPSTDEGEISLGRNVLIGFMTWEGYNYEDAVLISERLVKDDVYTSIHIEEYESEARDTKLGPEEITRDIPGVGEDALRDLDERGIIRIGAEVRANDILVGKVTPKGETELTAEERLLRAIFGDKAREVRDTSLRVPHGEFGIVVDVKIFTRENRDELSPGVNQMVRVYIAQKRKISVGDKMAGRHGNKGVVSRILPEEDMPFLPDGTPLDIVLNPLGVPSRMNIGQVLEVHLGLAAKALGWHVATPVFDGADENDIQEQLEKASHLPEEPLFDENGRPAIQFSKCGINIEGKLQLYDGRTGDPFDNKVTVGYMYMLKLHHLVDDKIHARSTGPYSLVTQQPLGGKAQFGGQRFGEMEVWALEAYGASHVLQEILTVKSDDTVGRVKTYEAIVKGENIPEPGIPESFRVLIKELQSLALDIKVLNADKQEIELKDLDEDPYDRESEFKEELVPSITPEAFAAEEENTEAEDFDFDDLELGDDDLGLDDDF